LKVRSGIIAIIANVKFGERINIALAVEQSWKGRIRTMDKLTNDKIYLNSIHFGIMTNFTPVCGRERATEANGFLKKAFDKLTEYEDTGLTPEEIKELLQISKSIIRDYWECDKMVIHSDRLKRIIEKQDAQTEGERREDKC
jgi:hypothetical protein